MHLSTLLTTALALTLTHSPRLILADGCRQQCERTFPGLEWDGSCGSACTTARSICQGTCHKRQLLCRNNCLKLYPCHSPSDVCGARDNYDFALCTELCDDQSFKPATCEEQCDVDWSRGLKGDDQVPDDGFPGLTFKTLWETCRQDCKDKPILPP